ncbi:MAG: bifunctional diguanylate cyclase/phosphodiesterase [Butyrivibrio sp.]|nr:bifunctional diguanylate cyclase/phosphodiesterase [Butyrivibrio sp.]
MGDCPYGVEVMMQTEEKTSQVLKYTYKDINAAMDSIRVMFDMVRLVDVEECREVSITLDGELNFGRECYAIWASDHRCANCTSYQSCQTRTKKSRIEHFEGKCFQVQSVPVELTLKDMTTYSCNMELITITEDDHYDKETDKDVWETSGYITTHDSLTGILNWEGFCKNARKLISDEPDENFLIISADIDNFRYVNSLFGNTKGNEVLVGVARIFTELFDKKCAIGRTGGVNFAICTTNESDIASILKNIAEKVSGLISSPSFRLSIHFGIYDVDNSNLPISIMFDRSYMALEAIRNNQQMIYNYFDENMMQKAIHEQQIINDFKKNLRSGQFVIYLQPQVNKNHYIEGAECLVRWVLPSGEVLPPFEFIGILEQVGLIGKLDEYVWELAARQLSEWKGTEYESLYLSVNVSPRDFYYLDIAKIFPALCKKYDIMTDKLHIEITETAVADETSGNMATLKKLHDEGFIVEIDDFGKGSSSLGLLKDIQADVLKIDMQFLQKSENEKRSFVILQSVIEMAKKLDMEIITEGVETVGQLDFLKNLGCCMFQGFYFSRPIPVAAFEKIIKDGFENL